VELEHCFKAGHDFKFITGNYKIETWPSREYNIVMGKERPEDKDMKHNRRIPNLAGLEMLRTSKQANLKLIEIIMLVLYTGPMVFLPSHPVRFQSAAKLPDFPA